MNNIQEIKSYVARHPVPNSARFQMHLSELEVFRNAYIQGDEFRTLCLIFKYGRAKGYQAAKSELRKQPRRAQNPHR